jgi:sugar lactone lactonase YvrE
MFSKSSMSLRRFSVIALTLLFVGSFCPGGAEAQTTPVVTAGFAQGLNHPSGWGAIEQTAVDSYGDWLVVDYANGALYEFPAGGGAEPITLVPAGGLGGGTNPGIAIDPANNLYLEANYNNCVMEFPYDTTTLTWDPLSSITAANPTTAICPNSTEGTSPYIFAHYNIASGLTPGYFQPFGLAVGDNDNLIIGSESSGNFIFSLAVGGAWSSPTAGAATMLVGNGTTGMEQRPISVAEDKFGNVYFVEGSGGLSGLYEIPAGETGLASDADLARVDPNLPSVSGVITDPNGNLYVSDSTDGVFMIPNPSGTPETASAVMLTPVPAQGEVAIDWSRHILYVPTTQQQSNGQADVAMVVFNAAEFGSATVGATPAQQTVQFGFGGSATPASIQIAESGTANPDFAVASGGSCTAGTAYAALSSCSVNVTFNPHSAGSISAKLLMVDGSGNVLASMPLHGTGTSAAVQFAGGAQSVIGAGLKTPSQVAVDAAGNVYVADSGLAAVEMYPQGYGATAATTTVGSNLTAPTGVAVDGAGDVFIADSGNVYEVPVGSKGLNVAGQTTLTTGLGSNLKLAVDGLDNVYILDPDNKRVVELSNIGGPLGSISENDITGFNTPSAIAVDSSGNLYVADGSNLDEVPPGGAMTTLLSSLSNATGLAVDASGSVYASMTGGTVRIPNESGTLNASDETTIATNVAAPASLALDAQGDVYIADGTALNVNVTSASAAYNFGTQTTPTGTASQTFTLLNNGNTALNVTGFSSTPDYSATETGCTSGAVAIDGTCTVTVTFNPGPGDDGTLTGSVVVQGNVISTPVGVNGTGVGYPLAASTTTITSGGPATTDNAPISVTVASTSATGTTPTGEVTLTMSATGITPITITEPLASGAAQFDPQNLLAGAYTFTVAYSGDRTYLKSSASAAVTVMAGLVTLSQPSISAVAAEAPSFQMPQAFQATLGSGTGYLVLSNSTGSDAVYDGTEDTWFYNYPVTVTAANGSPLTCVPVYSTSNGVQSLVRENCGSVTYTLSSGLIDCPSNALTSDQVNVSGTNGSAPLAADCLEVNNSNTTIPDLMTFYTITPVYNGTDVQGDPVDPDYSSFTGTPVNFWALRNPMVQIGSSPASLTVAQGSSVQATLTLTSVLGYGYSGRGSTLNNYALPLDLQCDGLPAYASCSFTYSAPISSDPNQAGVLCASGSTTQYCAVNVGPTPGITLSDGSTCEPSNGCIGPGTVVMTINTNTPTGTTSSLRTDPGSLAFAAMLGLGLLGLGFRRKAQRWGGLLLLVCVLLCGGGMFGITACGTTNLSPSSASVTPAGTYNVTVTAKETGTIQVQANGGTQTVYGNANQMSLPYTVSVQITN